MAELASLAPSLGFAIPQTTGAFNPTYTVPTYKPQDFEAALQFAAKPVDPNLFSGAIDNLGSTLSTIASPQFQLANATSRGGLNAYNLAGQKLAAANDPNNVLPSDATALPIGNASGAQVVAPQATVTATTPPTPQSGTVSNVTAPDADGIFHTTGTVFAGTNDINAYHAAKAAGATELQALAVGDNGIGAGGAHTADPTKNYVAASPAFMAANGLKLGDSLTVSANGKTTVATIGDHLPNNSKNGSGLDLNPGTANSLDVDPDHFKGPISFKIGGATPAPLPAGTSLVSDDGGALNKAIASVQNQSAVPTAPSAPPQPQPLLGTLPNVARPQPPGAQAATAIAQAPMTPVGSDVPQPAAVPVLATPTVAPVAQTPMLAPTYQAPPSTYQQQLTAAFGAGHPVISPTGQVGYETNAPLNPLEQAQVNLMPLTTQLKRQELAQEQQKIDQAAQLAPLQLDVERQKLLQTQRQAEAIASLTGASKPFTVPAGGLPGQASVPPQASNGSSSGIQAFAPGNQLVPRMSYKVENGVPQQVENPVLASALNNAGTHSVDTSLYERTFPDAQGNPQSYIDVTALGKANGAAARGLTLSRIQNEIQGGNNKFVAPYIDASQKAESVKANLLTPLEKRNADLDLALKQASIGIEKPGETDGEATNKEFDSNNGIYGEGGNLVSSLEGVPRHIANERLPHIATTIQSKLDTLRPAYTAAMQGYMNQLHSVGASEDEIQAALGPAYNYYKNAGMNIRAVNSPAQPAVPSGMVQMRSPSGNIGFVPNTPETIAAAQAKGGQIIQ